MSAPHPPPWLSAIAMSVLVHLLVYAGWRTAAPAHVPTQRLALQGVLRQATPRTAPTQPAAEPAAKQAAAPADAPVQEAFVPSDRLDQPVLPKSAPDLQRLQGLNFSGYPIRLRICIDVSGQVVAVEVLQAHADDAEAVAQMQAMFFATAYMPGQLHGHSVPSRTDLELRMESPQL
jgi:hypothetical protein